MKKYITLPLFFALVSSVAISGSYYPVYAQDEKKSEQPEVKDEKKDSEGEAPKEETLSETYKQLDLFGDVFERVRAQYVEKVTDKQLIEYALNGMLANLDPHSSYLNEEQFNEMKTDTRGNFGGLGIEVTMDNGLVKVVSPIDDTPAFRAGIQAGDYIVKINDEHVMGMALSDAVKKMRGEIGSEVKLEVHREGMEAPLELTLIRDVIQIRSVRHRVEGKSGYIRITTFNQNTAEGVEKAIKEISEKLGNDLNGYIIDMRNNPGGLLEQAIQVSDMFLEKGEIVSTRGREEENTRRDNATAGDLANGLPIVVLINGGSASASEIVSGALQDHKRAIIMGQKSFGKGSVQTVIPVQGNGAMRLTTARYYTPSGRSIQAMGIEPDIEVLPAHLETLANSSLGISEADLKGALKNDTVKGEDKKPENAEKDKSEISSGEGAEKSKDADADKTKTDKDKNEDQKEDYQLSRAVDLLQGLTLYRQMSEGAKP